MSNIEHIWTEYKHAMHGFIIKHVSDRHAAEDLVQDVFMKIHKSSAELTSVKNIRAWIYSIARNTITDYYRSRRISYELPEYLTYSEDDNEVVREISYCLEPMINNLPDIYRDTIMLSEIKGLTQKEVAAHQGISYSGAKSRVQRGREMLKDMMLKCCRFEFDRKGSVVDYEKQDPGCC